MRVNQESCFRRDKRETSCYGPRSTEVGTISFENENNSTATRIESSTLTGETPEKQKASSNRCNPFQHCATVPRRRPNGAAQWGRSCTLQPACPLPSIAAGRPRLRRWCGVCIRAPNMHMHMHPPPASPQHGARGRACSAEHRARARHVVGAQPGRVHVRSDLEVRRLVRVSVRLARSPCPSPALNLALP